MNARFGLVRGAAVFCVSIGLAWGCGLVRGPRTGGESHFLRYCAGECGSGLDCISGVCTRSCLVNESSCGDLHASAMCTNQSIEPGTVAICDVECTAPRDCAGLGAGFRCESGFCRGGTVMSSGGSGGSATGGGGNGGSAGSVDEPGGMGGEPGVGGTAGTVDGGAGTGGGPTEGCRALHQDHPLGAQRELLSASADSLDEPACTTCVCEGDWQCTERECGPGVPVFECPPGIESDAVDLWGARFQGDTLLIDVGHSGGCAQHDYGLCYVPGFVDSHPVGGELKLIHDGHGDECQGYPRPTLTFDLRPYAAHYRETQGGAAGMIRTRFGTYAFGELGCEARIEAASRQVSEAAAHAGGDDTLFQNPVTCSTADDCSWASVQTSCTAGCDTLVYAASVDRYNLTLADVAAHVCGNFEADGCTPPPLPPCLPPRALDCVSNACVVVE